MSVQMPGAIAFFSGWLLMNSHRVRKRRFEQIVVTDRDRFQRVGELASFFGVKLVDRAEMPFADEQRLVRPHRPKRHDDHEPWVFVYHPGAGRLLAGGVVTKQAIPALPPVLPLRKIFLPKLIREAFA